MYALKTNSISMSWNDLKTVSLTITISMRKGRYVRTGFGSQQPKAKDFRKHCCNVLFPHVQQQLTNKMKEEHQEAITDHQQQVLRLNEDHQEAIEEKKMQQLHCLMMTYKIVNMKT